MWNKYVIRFYIFLQACLMIHPATYGYDLVSSHDLNKHLSKIAKIENNNIKKEKSDEFCLKYGYVKNVPINLRNGPSKEYEIVSVIEEKYLPIVIQHKIDDWCQIKLISGITGWVKCLGLTIKGNMSITKEKTVLYRMPNKKHQIALLPIGMKLKILQCNLNLCRVIIEKEQVTGWIDKKFIWYNECNKH